MTHPPIDSLFQHQSFVTLAEYMAWNNQTYYAGNHIFGQAGDFITAPELTPLFGFCLAEWVLNELTALQSCGPVALIELGPGRGLLMRDILTVLAQAEKCPLIQPVLVETSKPLQQQQRQILQEFPQFTPLFLSELNELDLKENQAVIVIGNEFFDALPIQQYSRQEQKIYERCVALKQGRLEFIDVVRDKQELEEDVLEGLKSQEVYERCPMGIEIFSRLMTLLERQTGSCLFLDYGSWAPQGDTLQAVKTHQKVHPLEAPGAADLTAHVCFSAYGHLIPTTFQKAFTTQSRLLRQLGFEALLTFSFMNQNSAKNSQKPSKNTSKMSDFEAKTALFSLKKRLLGQEKEDMGALFKALEVKSYQDRGRYA